MKRIEQLARDEQYKWAKDMARTLTREPDETELRNLGRVPFEHAYIAGYRQAIEDAAKVSDTKSDMDLRCMNDCRLIIGDEIRALLDQPSHD
jgi:hypothetical protein